MNTSPDVAELWIRSDLANVFADNAPAASVAPSIAKPRVAICIGGFNIAQAKGSGIATCGRNLLSTIEGLGMNGQALYGPAAKRSQNNVVNETALVDAGRPGKKRRRFDRFQKTLTSRFGRTAWPITPGELVWPRRGGGCPEATTYGVAQHLLQSGNRSFGAFGKETPVVFEGSSEVRRPDAMHWTATPPLYARAVPNIYTIHDLIPLRLPHTTMDDKAVYMAMYKAISRRADHIAVVSETTRQDVIRMLGVLEGRFTNSYQAVNLPEALTSRTQADVTIELKGVLNLGWKDYFLHIGAIEPKKNLISLIRGAKATLFPSLYEGFGLPLLEPTALSTAVLTSTGGSLPEVAGDAAISVGPYDVQAMTRGLRALDADEALRDDLVRRGLSQATKFSVEAYQGRLSDMYGRLGLS